MRIEGKESCNKAAAVHGGERPQMRGEGRTYGMGSRKYDGKGRVTGFGPCYSPSVLDKVAGPYLTIFSSSLSRGSI